jgi:single-strand DNA-binding protein
MEMTSLNRVELRGRVGQDPRINDVGESQVARFSIATNETYKDKKGDLKEETTWHNIAVWSGKSVDDFKLLKKGSMVSVVGKLRMVKYTASSGEEKQYTEVLANRMNVFQAEVGM